MKTEATCSVLITGGALRIGRALCLAMAAQGWTVRVHYRHAAAAADTLVSEIEAAGGAASTHGGDLATSGGPEALRARRAIIGVTRVGTKIMSPSTTGDATTR